VPFFINKGECIFLSPFSSDIWDKKNVDDFFHNRLTFSEKQKITQDEKRYLNPSTVKNYFPFQVGELKYFFTPIIAPSLKKFLLSTLKNQQKSPYLLKELLSKKIAVKIIGEYLKLIPPHKHEEISTYVREVVEKDIDTYQKTLQEYSRKEKKLQNQLRILKEKNGLSFFCPSEQAHPYKTSIHILKREIISQQKGQEQMEKIGSIS
jgi:hypothetical protein